MRFALIVAAGLLAAAPVMAEEVIIQGPNVPAAQNAARAAHRAGEAEHFEASQARRDQGIANYDASRGNYAGAARAEDAAHNAAGAARHDERIEHRDANISRSDDSTRVQVLP